MAVTNRQQALRLISADRWRVVVARPGGGQWRMTDVLGPPSAWLQTAVPPRSAAHVATRMAMAAWHGEISAGQPPARRIGISATASGDPIASEGQPLEFHVALQTATATRLATLQFSSRHRDHDQRLELCADLIVAELLRATATPQEYSLPLLAGENVHRQVAEAGEEWAALLLRQQQRVAATPQAASATQAVLPGAFHPLHRGHLMMREHAARWLGSAVAFELSVFNVDKPPLDYLAVKRRLFPLESYPTWLTGSATFLEKMDAFPGATFVVGADTVLRVADPRYYGGDPQAASAAVRAIAAAGCRFLVYGRRLQGRFTTLTELSLPRELLAICDEVPASEFRIDISSTELRRSEFFS